MSHAQPLPNRPTAAFANCSLNASKLPNDDLIASAIAPVGAPQVGRHVPGVDVAQGAAVGVQLAVEEGDVAAGLGVLVEEAVEPLEHLRRPRRAGQRLQRGVHRGHHDAGGRALARDVGDHEGEAAAFEGDEVVVVAPDLVARAADGGQVEARDARQRAREQAALDLAGDLQLAVLALLLDPDPVQVRRLERRLGLARQRCREVDLLLAVGTAGRAFSHG